MGDLLVRPVPLGRTWSPAEGEQGKRSSPLSGRQLPGDYLGTAPGLLCCSESENLREAAGNQAVCRAAEVLMCTSLHAA